LGQSFLIGQEGAKELRHDGALALGLGKNHNTTALLEHPGIGLLVAILRLRPGN